MNTQRVIGPRLKYLLQSIRYRSIHNNDFSEWNYRLAKSLYFQGLIRGSKKIYKDSEKIQDGGCYRFPLINIPTVKEPEFGTLLAELVDMLFPYTVYSEAALREYLRAPDVIVEGPYECRDIMVSPGDVVIDAGANVGIFTVFAAKYRKAKVHAFEPVPQVFNLLEKVIDWNGINKDVTASKYALLDYCGECSMDFSECNIGGSKVVEPTADQDNTRNELVEVITVDEYVKKNNISKVDYIKADIEGSEKRMLLGAIKTLEKDRPKLAVCTYHRASDREDLTKIIMSANENYKIHYSSHKLYAI